MAIMIILSGIFGVVGAAEICKCARMHELNSLHLKHNYLFAKQSQRFQQNPLATTGDIRRELQLVRKQPVDCLEMIGWVGRNMTRLLGTYEAVEICEQDIQLADRTLAKLTQYDQGTLERPALIQTLQSAEKGFAKNSNGFEPLVAQTVSIISTAVIWLVAMKAFLVGAVGFTMSRSVGRDYVRLELAEQALEESNETLEQRVLERTRELAETQSELVDAAHKAGMAEIAIGVLHNVGNVLNSVNTSALLIGDRLNNPKRRQIDQIIQLLETNRERLGEFITVDERGKHIPLLLSKLTESMSQDDQDIIEEVHLLADNVDHIKTIVASQQSFAGAKKLIEAVDVRGLLDNALRINSGITKHSVRVEKEYDPIGVLMIDKHRTLQIIVNLIKNAIEAMLDKEVSERLLTVRAMEASDNLIIEVCDNGVGIAADNLIDIFNHGFSTKKDGHGFGLHSCANVAREMGGKLTASSDGPGFGATFTLTLPARSDTTSNPTQQEECHAS